MMPRSRAHPVSHLAYLHDLAALLRWLMVAVVVAAVCTAPLVGGTAIAQTAPSHVSITLYGCSFSASVTIPAGGPCLDRQYTKGNLGTGWNELDLVPFRLITIANNSAPAIQTYDVAIMADFEKGTVPGFDVISVPVLNTALSSPSCRLTAVGPQSPGPTVGGNKSNYRMLTITQDRNTTCVFDYYARLAIGSSGYPGSSLHGYWADPDLTRHENVPLPVGRILPQVLSKDMTASRNTSFIWDVATKVEPARLAFTNTCDTTATRSASGNVTVSWTRFPAQPSGDIYVVTNVYASNPSSRPITVTVQDVIRSGTTPENTASVTNVTVPANTRLLVMTHTASLNPASLPSPPNLNDVATATYTDPVSGVPIPQTTSATASAGVENAPPQNTTATINDTEGIAGSGLTFSVASPPLGSFAGGYVPGTQTTGPVTWHSPTQSASGSVTFQKTVYAAPPAATSGALTTTSLLTGSSGYTAQARGTTTIVASGQGAPTSSVSLVTNGANITVQAPYAGLDTITINSSSNANVTIPPFTSGTTSPVVVSVTQQDPSIPAHVSLTATAIGGCPTVIDVALGQPTPTPTSTGTPVPTATHTPAPTPTNTSVPTATGTAVATATNTPVPTPTGTPAPTNTPAPGQPTPLPTSTATPVPTPTNTPVPAAIAAAVVTTTNTPVPTPTGAPAPTPTSTPVTGHPTPPPPPTFMPTPTATTPPLGAPARILASARVHRHGRIAIIHWRMAYQLGIKGFRIYAGHRLLTRSTIHAHHSPQYTARVPWVRGGTYVLQVLYKNGHSQRFPVR